MDEKVEVRSPFSEEEDSGVIGYRPVSRLAIASLVLGLLSLTAAISPLLWLVPLLGIVISLAALRATSQRDGSLAGRWAAVAGLLLAVLVGGWAPARHFSREATLIRQAQRHCRSWIEIVQEGRLHEAHQLHLPFEQRDQNKGNLASLYQPGNPHQVDFTKFFDQAPLKAIVAAGKNCKLKWLSGELTHSITVGTSDSVQQHLQLTWREGEAEKKLDFSIIMVRRIDQQNNRAHWFVGAIETKK